MPHWAFVDDEIIEGAHEHGDVVTARIIETDLNGGHSLVIEHWVRGLSDDDWYVSSGIEAIDLPPAAVAKLLPIVQRFLASPHFQGDSA